MTDFSVLKSQVNTGASDASPTWTDSLFGTGGQELRLCGTGAGAGSTSAATWPTYLRPGVPAVIPEMWAFSSDSPPTGLKVSTYDGTAAHYRQWRINWDGVGTFASAPIISAWKDNTLPAASPGTQPTPGDGSAFINGSLDTSPDGNPIHSTSYIKANAYGRGAAPSGSIQDAPNSNANGTLAATTGTAGAVSPPTTPDWLATWQSLQSLSQYIQDAVTPQAQFAAFWYTVLAFFTGPLMSGGVLLPVLGFQYTWV